VGRPLVYRYLGALAFWALLIAYASLMLITAYPQFKAYGLVIIGSMFGAWAFAAYGRRQVSFDDLQDYVDFGLEPFVRLFFVAVMAFLLALLFQFKAFDFKIGDLSLSEMLNQPIAAVLFGLVAGLSEKAWSVKVIERVQQAWSGTSKTGH
jgi:hypothetical protein